MEETASAVIPAQILTLQTPSDVQAAEMAAVQTQQTSASVQSALIIPSLPLARYAEPALPAHVPATASGIPALTAVAAAAAVVAAAAAAADVAVAAVAAAATIMETTRETQAPTLFLIQPAAHSQQAQLSPFAM